ncbi:hypothetical protein [Mycolicibacterium sp. CBMA 226]|uniref:hypothetical protein n=1 Tax=Mycolicibacterium sp. CBMA 226 TaxID=2606611 RepID=UPI0012DC6A64|nr:hypothetical protein [Mycolicibacterium sp. CBMA 226]MUL77254.1 hypothetical protein [Mycolicibacterium sp. CBMA 226]
MVAPVFDVAGRLAEGERALTLLDEYVAACQVLGLPSAASLPAVYHAESGLELAALSALSADARSLDAAVAVAQDALRLQGNGYRELTAQWAGTGGDAAGGFLRSLAVAAEDVVAHLQRSAQALTTLRDDLWRAVDAKVDAVLRADAQAAGQRDRWSAAARAVLAGAGDLAAASEVVDQQVKPFVVRVVAGDLVPALQDASDAVAAAYDSAITAVTPATVSFAVPFVMTPEWTPPASSLPPAAPAYQAAAAAPFGTLGAAAGWTPSAASMPAEPAPAPALGTAGAPEPALGTAAATPAAGGLPGDLGLGSGIGSLGQQLTDAIGGVLGSMAGLAPGASGLSGLDDIRDGLGGDLGRGTDDTDTGSDVDHDGDDEPGDKPDDDAEGGAAEDVAAEGEDAASDDGESADTDSVPVDAPAAPLLQTDQPVADPALTAPPVEPLAEQANPTTKTPCEIAADELPNVGE